MRSNDDGEPSGTAGAPMLEVLRGRGLTDVVAVVTRWFGGTLLGTGGLIRAYGDAVSLALDGASLLRMELREGLVVEVDHAAGPRLEHSLRGQRGVEVTRRRLPDSRGAACTLRLLPTPSATVERAVAVLTSGAGSVKTGEAVLGAERPTIPDDPGQGLADGRDWPERCRASAGRTGRDGIREGWSAWHSTSAPPTPPTSSSSATRWPCCSACSSTSRSRWRRRSPRRACSPSGWACRRTAGSTPPAIAALPPETLLEHFRTPPALHRFPGSMATRTQQLCQALVDDWGGDAANVWAGVDSGTELVRRIGSLPGFGDQKARIFAALLAKQFGVTPDGWESATGDYGKPGHRSIADVVDGESRLKVRAFKQAKKAEAKTAQAATTTRSAD